MYSLTLYTTAVACFGLQVVTAGRRQTHRAAECAECFHGEAALEKVGRRGAEQFNGTTPLIPFRTDSSPLGDLNPTTRPRGVSTRLVECAGLLDARRMASVSFPRAGRSKRAGAQSCQLGRRCEPCRCRIAATGSPLTQESAVTVQFATASGCCKGLKGAAATTCSIRGLRLD